VGENTVLTNNASVISIILPVLNEIARINQAIARLRGLRPGAAIEIIVVDGDPRGGTVKAIRDRQVKIAISEEGRARQMNRGASLSSGNVLLFLHADTFLPADALVRIKEAMADGRQVAGAFDLGIRTKRRIFRITEKYAALRTRLTRIPFGDQAIFIRKDYFNSIGGYKDIPLMEDVELMSRIKKAGDAIFIIHEQVMTSARRWEKEGILYCTLRNWALQLSYVLGVPPERLAKWYKPVEKTDVGFRTPHNK
jgi:rSAM/selenodomain-associated transferase 2